MTCAPATSSDTSTHSSYVNGQSYDGSTDTPATLSTATAHPTHLDKDSVSIAHKENSAVLAWRIVVIAVLVLSTVGVALAVFYYVDRGEQDEFQTRFSDDSFKILEALGNSLDLKLGAIDAFVVPLVSYAAAFNMTWPLVTVADHAIRASKIRSLTNAIAIEQYHVVTGDDERSEWEEYTISNDQWVRDAIAIQTNDHTLQGETVSTDEAVVNMSGIHFGGNPVSFGKKLYAPSWQAYPIYSDIAGVQLGRFAASHAGTCCGRCHWLPKDDH